MAWDDEDLRAPGQAAVADYRARLAAPGNSLNVMNVTAQPWQNTIYTTASSVSG